MPITSVRDDITRKKRLTTEIADNHTTEDVPWTSSMMFQDVPRYSMHEHQ